MSSVSDARSASRKVTEWTDRRDEAIRSALAEGASLRDVAKACGLSHTAVAKIRDR